MAQVRKFQSGGKTFKINGKTYNTSNSEDMKRLEEMASNSEHGGIAQQILANVNDAAYDNTLNVYRTSDGRVMMEGGLQNVADQFMSEGIQKATQRKDNIINNAIKRRSGKEWINGLDSFITNWDKPSTSSSTSSTDGKIKISGVSGLGGQWKYNDQGWDEADINNAAMLKELQLLEDYYNASEEDRNNKYDVSGLDKRSLEAYINMRQNNPNLYSNYLKSFKADAPLMDNDDFYSTYGWFGFIQDPDAKKAVDNKALKEYLATQGLDFDGAENVFYRDKDGNLMVTDAFLTNVLGGDRNGHYWLNDNWANLKTENGNTNPYSQMRNHIIWNGRIYKQDDADVLAELQKSGYIDANKAYDATKAEQIMRTQWSDNPTFAHEAYDPETRYSEWAHGYKDKGLRYRTLESNLGEGRNLVEYYTNDDPTDAYGFRSTRYAIVGDDGKLIQDNVDPSSIAKTENGQYVSGTTYFMTERLGKDAGALAGTYINGTSVDGKPSNTFFYKNPTTGEFFIQDPDLKGKQKGKVVRIPKEIATMVPEEAWEYFRTNKAAKDRLFGYLKNFTNTGWGKFWNQGDGLFGVRNISLRSDFRKAGLSKEQAEQIVRLLNEWGTNKKYKEFTGKYDASSTARQQAFLADPQTGDIVQPAFKEGGKIEKHQYGKVLGQQGKTELKTINLKESDRKDANTNQSFGLGSKDSKQWSSLDTAELLATVGDLSSLALSFVPGAHLGAAGVGGAASTAQFVTDIKRDGFQGKDALNYAVNLGFDALSGFTGAGGKVAKVMKNFPKTAKILQKAIKAGAIVGVGDAIYNTIDKIAKGESFTLSDVRRIANGVAGGITLSKTGLLSPRGKKVSSTADLNIKSKKQGVADFTLDGKEIDKILEMPEKEQTKALLDHIAKKTGKQTSELRDLYDIDSLLKDKKSLQLKFWKGRKNEGKVPDLGKSTTTRQLKDADLDELAAQRNGFQNWFFGTGKKQRLFNGMFEGNNPLMRQEIVMPENTTPGLISLNVPAVVRQVPGIRSSYINLPNFGSHQQFPQEMEFTENVSTIPSQRLVFKKGGVLKAQPGTTGDFWKDIEAAKKRRADAQTAINNGYKVELPTSFEVVEDEVVEPIDQALVKGRVAAIKDIHKGDRKGKNAALTSLGNEIIYTNPMGGTPTKSGNVEWDYLNKEIVGLGNSLAAKFDANRFKQLANQKADIYSKGQPSIWNGRGRMRFQSPTMNLVNQQIAANNTIAGMMNTADAHANIAGKLGLAEMNSNVLDQGNRIISQEFSNNLDKHAATLREDDKLAFETGNAARQWGMNTGMLRNAGDIEYVTNMGAIRDKDFNKIQSDLARFGTVSVRAQNIIDQLKLKRATPGLNADQIANIDDQIKMIGSPEYQNILRRQAMFGGVTSAKKGTKLRSTTEQMLLDNNKIVAKAISKLSDNTMKLILKAMS